MEGRGDIRGDFQSSQKIGANADNFLPHAGLGLEDRGLNVTLAIFCRMGRTLLSLIMNNLSLYKD